GRLHGDLDAPHDDGRVDRLREVEALAHRTGGGEEVIGSREVHEHDPPGQACAAARRVSISAACFGTAADSTPLPSAVTSTAAPIRMPMPRNGAGTSSASGGTYSPGSTVNTMPGSRARGVSPTL